MYFYNTKEFEGIKWGMKQMQNSFAAREIMKS